MMRFLMLPVLALTLALAGCAGFPGAFGTSLLEGGVSVTATINNPVTLEQAAAAEAAYNLGATAIVTYARLPRCAAGQSFTASRPCSSWPVVQRLKTVNRVAYAQLLNLRTFMDKNDQISAITVYNALMKSIRDLRATAYVNGIDVPAQ